MGRAAVLVGFGALVVAAVSTFALLTVFSGDSADDGSADEPVAEWPVAEGDFTLNALRWSTRDSLAVCVERGGAVAISDELSEADAAGYVVNALEEVTKHSHFDKSPALSAAADAARVNQGCPSDARLDCAEPSIPPIRCPWPSTMVRDPDPYTLFVFVVSESDLQTVLGGDTLRLGVEEEVCVEDVCWPVAGSVYITPEELRDPIVSTKAILFGLGLGQGW